MWYNIFYILNITFMNDCIACYKDILEYNWIVTILTIYELVEQFRILTQNPHSYITCQNFHHSVQ